MKGLKMKNRSAFIAFLALCTWVLMVVSCSQKETVKYDRNVVINELMASNRTGLLTAKGKPADWIELKNVSADTVNLEGYGIAVVKADAGTAKKKDAGKKNAAGKAEEKDEGKAEKKGEKTKTWVFPSVTMRGGECLVVFVGGKDKAEKKGKELRATVKLPKEGGTVKLLAPDGEVISEVTYGALSPDEALCRQEDGSYVKTYWQSPGFDNTAEGYEAACERMDEQREGGELLIWEVMSRAQSRNNWVELKNVSDDSVDLSAYCLAKKMGKDEGWQLPARTLLPGQMVTIELAGRKANKSDDLQAPFKLGKNETVVLTKGGRFVDGVCAKAAPYGASVGRADGRKGFFFYASPSRNAENGAKGVRFVADRPQFDCPAGVYPEEKQLCLHLNDAERVVHYTLDGSEPTAASPVCTDSIVLTKSTVVRAFAEGDDEALRSDVATMTYLLGTDADHDLAVVAVSVDEDDLYDFNKGIYADGPGYSPEWPHLGANFWKRWTKKAHVEFFDGKEGFSTDCGLKIFGGYSRYEAKKSFCLKFKNEYGQSEVDYDVFGNGETMSFQDLVLRSGSQDFNRCMVRDEFFTSLVKAQSPTLLTQIYRPVALYINAKYFGLYYIREKIDRHFVARHLNVSEDGISIIFSQGYNEAGSSIPYKQLMKYVADHNMADSVAYDSVRKQVDLQGLIDYKLGEIYSGNTDVGNIRYVRSTDPKGDGKWHFVFYDLDATWVGFRPTADYYLSMGGSAAAAHVTAHNVMINRLLANPEFRALFLQRLSHHMTHTFSTENATAEFDRLIAQIRPEMKRNCERWPQLSYEKWEKNVAEFREKFAQKPKIMLDDIRKFLSITEEENQKYFGKLGF